MSEGKNVQKNEVKLEDIVSLCKRRGFIYQGSEIYGGLAGTWDYGPLGVALKRNIMNLWWKMFVDDRDDMYGVDAAILMNQKVWQASGHAGGFTDPVTIDIVSQRSYRADHILKENGIDPLGMDLADMTTAIIENKIKSPDGNDLSPVGSFNMMFQTHSGASSVGVEVEGIESMKGEVVFTDKEGKTLSLNVEDRKDMDSLTLYRRNERVYLRPETAQGIFTNYKNVVDSYYPTVPFGIAQQGKAFRNEISPRDFIFRDRELEQMEIEYFVHPDDWERYFEEWKERMLEWCEALGLDRANVHELEVPKEDRAHYSKRTVDLEYDFPIGKEELYGLAYRTDFDLANIQRASGKNMEYRPKDGSTAFVPHVIEPTFGVERSIMAVLTAAYWNDTENDRIVLKLPYALAPVKVAVCPLAKNNPELVAKARDIYAKLKAELGAVLWIDSGNIGKNYRKMDEIGVPYVVTVDFDTLEGDTKDTVTVRTRDTLAQERHKTLNLIALLSRA